jgi:geranylgeranyl diphosphate synthase type II
MGPVCTALTESPPPALSRVASQFEEHLEHRLARLALPEALLEAVQYAMLGGGKRLRPVLLMLSCRAVGGADADALGPAAAIELIHAFSLVHDDLPAMDNDRLRRGRPTLHVHAGEAMAILAGDAMMSLAFELVLESPGALGRGDAGHLVRELSQATTAMIAGQVYDTLGGFPPELSDRERLDLIHHSKTGAIIRAACRMGAICGGAAPDQLRILSRYGEAIGLMFQIVDDVLDVTQTTEHLGKSAGKDQSAGKLTFPGLIGVEASRQEVARLRSAAGGALEPLGEAAWPLRELADYMAMRTR